MACCLPTCAQGSSVPVMGTAVFGVFWAFWFLLGVLCIWRVLVLLVSLLCTRLGLLRCGSCWTRLSGVVRRRHYLCNHWRECQAAHKIAIFFVWFYGYFISGKPYMPALVGRPSLHGYDACMVYWITGAFRRNCSFRVFLFSRNSRERFWGLVFWHLWFGRAWHPGPNSTPPHLGVEILNVGGWLTHGDLPLDARVDFLAVVEHRLIPARVRSEWSRLRSKGMSSIWAPASQVSSHVGNAGVGVIGLRGVPLSLPTFATSQFKRFFDCGRVVRCMLPLGFGRFMHLVVLYCFQVADTDAEQLSLTEQLFDAA